MGLSVFTVVTTLCLCITWLHRAIGQTLVLQTIQNLDGCRGGEICDIQPVIVVINKETLQIEYSFAGNVYALLEDSPTGYETMYIGQDCDLDSCGQQVVGSLASVPFVSGVARFENLLVKEAGQGYTLKFIGRKAVQGILFAEVIGQPFEVTVGAPYKLAFSNYVGTAFAGQVFVRNPAVAVVDRGGNIVTAATAYTDDEDIAARQIRAVLTACPFPDLATVSDMKHLLQPESRTVATIYDGVATFEGLYMNRTGYPYQITFYSNMTMLASAELTSDYFDIITGPAAKLAFVQGYEVAFSPKFSGEFFPVPPRLRLLDAGGNFVSTDNSTALKVSIRHNPTGKARIGPKESLFVVAKQGIVSFNALSIDTQGHNYTLMFTLWEYSPLAQRHIETSISIVSEKFEVLYGPPRKLVFAPGPHSQADGAWAGNQAFTQQPVLQLQDYGGNPRRPDFTSTVTASIVPSLSVGLHNDVLVDTSDAPQTVVQNVSLNLEDGEYGAGQVVDITVTFAVNVWVIDESAPQLTDPVAQDLPYLLLSVSNARTGESEVPAHLIGALKQTKILTFRYVVQPGDSSGGLGLDCTGPAALVLNHTAIVDGNARAVNLTLSYPLLTVQQAVVIDTSAPSVQEIDVDTADGEYGAGQEIVFSLTFDMPVVVEGFPFLLLNVTNSTGDGVGSTNCSSNSGVNINCTADGSLNADPTQAAAVYSHSSDDEYVLYFLYTVREGDHTAPRTNLTFLVDSIQASNATLNATVVTYVETVLVEFNASAVNATINGTDYNISAHYQYGYDYSTRVAAFIRRRSNVPVTLANYSLAGLTGPFSSQHSIAIDTTPPQLDAVYGLQTTHADGTFYPGEHIYLTVRFDKPVVVSGVGIYLDMDAGPHSSSDGSDYLGFAYIERLHADSMTVEFLYIVEKNTNASRLEIQPGSTSLIVPEETAFIRRASTHPITAADANTTYVHGSVAALRYSAALQVIGYAPGVLSTTLLSTFPPAAAILYPDNFALIEVTFSAPVLSTCSPVLMMSSKYFRAAEYVSGNLTDTYVFQYTVQTGDEAPTLQYRHTPYPICPVVGCPQRTNCQMLASSTVPSLPVYLKSFRTGSQADLTGGVTLANIAVQPLSLLRDTTVTRIECAQAAGEYGAGSVLDFLVTFTDIVILVNTSSEALPRLHLNIGQYATYGGGNYDTVLKFTYVTTTADVMTPGDLLPSLIGATASALFCDAAMGCGVLNQAGADAILDTSPAIFVASGVTLDPTAPVVTSIFTNKPTSSYQEAQYSVGENILIFVTVDKPVVVTGFDPRIEMNVTHPERFALYNATLSTPSKLAFVYTVREGDQSLNLAYMNPYIDLYGDNCRIYRLSSIPTTLMDVTLPPPTTLATVGNVIHIDTLDIPRVTNVTSLSSPRLKETGGVMYAGDQVTLRVDFDREVLVVGYSYLTLNVGDHVRRARYFGYYQGDLDLSDSTITELDYNITLVLPNSVSNATRHLFYLYEVEAGDFTADLDYTDVFSLLPGKTANNDTGYIVHASSEGRLGADLELAKPAYPGSLSADGAVLRVDGRTPYVTSLAILTPPGTYSTNHSILIGMNFSAPVHVVGVPSIKLETGLVDNSAFYVSGSGSSALLFSYHPEPGDMSADLDYHADRAKFASAAASFHYNGGKILQYSTRPFLPADIWLNPPHGALLGTTIGTSISGVFRFHDLHIDWRGPDYQIRYSTEVPSSGTILTTTQQPLDVSFSSERQLRPLRALKGQRVGHAVDIDGDIAVLGCPNCNNSVTTIQAVVTSAAEGEIVREVQLLQTTIVRQPAIQSFHTTAAVGSAVGGGFKLSQGSLGFSQLIPANADYRVMEAVIKFDLPSLGNVSVTREAYIFCACDNAYTWTLTFNDIDVGNFSPLTLDGGLLTGNDASIIGPKILQTPALLGGTFTLSAVGLTTAPIPYDANVARMKSAVAELGIPVFDIFMYPTEPTRTRSWSITFDAYKDSYEMPTITADGAGLTGGTTDVFLKVTRPGRHGPFGIAGHFALTLRGNTTRLLRSNCSAVEMKEALEELPVINYVNVDRSVEPVLYGYTWTIEFVSVNLNSPRGLVLQDTSNVEALVATNKLIATQPVIDVQARYALGSRNQITGLARQGTYGSGAGAVHVYQRRNETWDEMATLRGNDTVENNFFGESVSLLGDVVLIGAIGANMNGRPEKQSIFCSAESGAFKIHFRGWSTAEIPYDATRTELLEAIVSDSRIFDKLYTVTALDVDDWGGGPLCANNTAVLTFYSPVDGAELLLGTDTGPDLELLAFEEVGLQGPGNSTGIIFATEVQAGSWRLHNVNSDPQQIGAAYIFRAEYDCDGASELCRKSRWVQEAQLFPLTSRAGSRFGTSVALSAEVALVGAPGSFNEKGTAYVFQYDSATGRWNNLQMLVFPLVVQGDNFGSSVALSGDTAIVSASNYRGGIGGVFVFTRTTAGGAFIAAQSLAPSPSLITLNIGDNYGASISIDGNLVVVGATKYSDTSVYFGDQPSTIARTQSGAVFVFERVSPAFNFKYIQKLKPSNVQEFDGFGESVDIDGKNLVVSSLQDYEGELSADKPIIEVMTHCKYDGDNLAGSFKLKWLTADSGATYTTRFILHDASAAVMKDILEADLPTGPLLVTRSRVDVYDGGYAWSITFLDYDAPVPLFQADAKMLSGVDAGVSMRYINPSPDPLRGKAHIFQRPDVPFSKFVEQLFLTPHVHQAADRCGQSARISGTYALIGCPNRDLRVPTQNSGAGYVYHLGLLAVQYTQKYTVLEGNTAPIQVVHDAVNIADIDQDLLFFTQTVDRNAFAQMQKYIRHLFGIPVVTETYPDSMLDRTLMVGKANARTQFYGSLHNESQWVDGLYDYRGVSDYVPIKHPQAFLIEYDAISDAVITTGDSIFETPDEHVVLAICTPGVWPSVFGSLYGQIRIYDPADGNVWAEPQYRKLYDSTGITTEGISTTSTAAAIATTSSTSSGSVAETKSEYAHSVAYNEDLGVMVVGVPSATVNGRARAGKAILYTRNSGGNWTQSSQLFSPFPSLKGTRFGDAVAVSRIYERNVSIMAIGEPSLNRIHVYVSEGSDVGENYVLDTTLFCDSTGNSSSGDAGISTTTSQRFGERGSIALYGFLLVVAAPSLETSWVYRRVYRGGTWEWSEATMLRSTDYDFDVIQGASYLHRQDFGQAVAAHERTIVIGAPFADYDNIGTRNKFGRNLVETQWDTEGTSMLTYARGSAYVFYSAPSTQEIRIFSAERLYYGEFQLNYFHEGSNETTTTLRFDAPAADVKTALLSLSNIDDVSVAASSMETSTGFIYTWTVTYISDWQEEQGLLTPFYFGRGCANCTEFSVLAENNSSEAASPLLTFTTTVLSDREPLAQVQRLSAVDRRNGDRFGAAVAVDGDIVVVGAPTSATMTTTSWNFEAGHLLGWHRTGDAFDFQPTFGDNSYLRGVHEGRQGSSRLKAQAKSSGLEGYYYIGTFEKRPGDPLNYRSADRLYPEGGTQGDGPRGTLSSDVFIVRGDKISFLVGGGCDVYLEYVELLVDGMSVSKHTGQCSEKMRPVHFDVGLFRDRAAQIRIVDNSTANWGHINVDHFQFDWDVTGATVPNKNHKTTAGGFTEAPVSGAAYIFHRVNSAAQTEKCDNDDKHQCMWVQEVRLAASDKRQDMLFGSAVAVNDAAGLVLVGAPSASFTGFYKEDPSVFPYLNASDYSTVANLHFPVDPAGMLLFQSSPLAIPERSGAFGVWSQQNEQNAHAEARVWEKAGAVYAFVKQHEKLAADGKVIRPQYWSRIEQAKVQPPDAAARDEFGSSFALSGMSVAVGAPGQDGLLHDAGAVYVYSTEFAALSFSATEYPIVENRLDRTVTVTILRDLSVYAGAMAIEYATSDLTARGVDAAKYAACLLLSVGERAAAGCGDYEQTTGVVVIAAGDTSGGFTVRIVDDLCRERFMEYIQVSLSVPGSAALQGERLSAKIRIDDNDYDGESFC